jgi:hypothetical protein
MKIKFRGIAILFLSALRKNVGAILVFIIIFFTSYSANAQKIAVKTNALEWATISPNISAEFVVSPTMSLDLSASFNKWTPFSNVDLDHLKIQPELRYWFQRPMAQHFVGFTVLYIDYDIVNKGICHDGQGIAGGFTYGYDFVLSKRWNLELTAGVGALYRFERKYEVGSPRPTQNNANRWCLMPIKLGVTVSYVIF